MAKVITLPSGNTVTLRDPKTLRVKDRTKVFEAAANDEGALAALSMTNGLIAVMVQEWSFDLIIPSVSIKSLQELEIPDYDKIAIEVNKAQSILFPDFTNDEDTDSPKDSLNA